MKKKIITAVLTASVLLSFASCDSAPAETSESANEYERQLQTIYDNVDVWRLSDEDNVGPDWLCFYAIADLDRDGYLEVLKRTLYNNGPNTQLWIYEVTEDGGITALESDLEDPDSDYRTTHYPEFSIDRPTAYYEEGGVYRYLLCDCISYGVACVYDHYGYLSIQDDRIYYDFVCTELAEDAGSLVTYYDGESNMISEAEYEALHDEYISNVDGEVMIEWFLDSEIDMDHIAESYSSFAGCSSSVETQPGPVDMTLSVLKTGWYESGHTNYEPVTYNPLEVGDVVYEDDYYEIVIESVTEDMIILNVDGALIEPNSDGTINLRADPIEEIELAAGESIELVSQTMDAGIQLKIAFE